MKKTVLLALLLPLLMHFRPLDLKAQLRLENEPQITSPNVAAMIKADNHSVNLYTGRMSVSIPIYTYKDRDFSIPISLHYDYNGMRPNEVPSEVGLGWFLDCGGAITREVKGFPDEERGQIPAIVTLPDEERGQITQTIMYYDVLEYDSIPPSASQLCPTPDFHPIFLNETSFNPLKTTFSYEGKTYDYSPDIYHFSFMGHSGCFIRELDGTFSVFGTSDPCENYRITKTNKSSGDESPYPFSEITITLGDGYEYVFGSLSEKYLYNDRNGRMKNEESSSYKDFEPQGITSWKLRKIIAPSGSELVFIYGWKYDEPLIIDHYGDLAWESVVDLVNGSGNDMPTTSDKLTYIYSAVLEGVEVNGERITTFRYDTRPSDKNAQWVAGTNTGDVKFSPLLLCEIDFLDVKALLTHSFNTSGNPYPFLSDVSIDGVGSYRMDYNNGGECYFPPYGTNATDHWGYQNRNNASCNLSTIVWDEISILGTGYSENLGASIKSPDPNSSCNGLMTKLTYPTGGWTTFEYQPNDYSRRLDRRADSMYAPELFPENGIGPGHRIHKISHYDTNGSLMDGREYKYTDSESTGRSSGQLLANPRHRIVYKGSVPALGYSPVPVLIYYGTTTSIISFESVYLEYPRVEEIRLDGGRSIYSFSSWNDVPDSFDFRLFPVFRFFKNAAGLYVVGEVTDIKDQWILNSILLPGANMQSERGRLLSVSSVSADSNTVDRTVENTYSYSNNMPRAIMSSFVNVGEKMAIVPVFTEQRNLLQTCTTDYYPSGSVKSSTSFTYNAGGQIVSETTSDSNGNLLRTIYKYLSDIQNRTAAQRAMFEAGFTAFPISVSRETKARGENEWQTEQVIQYDYAAYRNNSGKTYYNLSAVRELDADTDLFHYKYQYVFGPSGQMTQRIDENGHCVSYVWASFQMGVALIIENATNQEVRIACETNGIPDVFSHEPNQYDTEVIAAKLRATLKNARITSITYSSYNNPSRITDCFGKTTTYEYDSNERLVSTSEEGIGKINSFYYNTKTR